MKNLLQTNYLREKNRKENELEETYKRTKKIEKKQI